MVAAMLALAGLWTSTPTTAAPRWSVGGALGGGSYSNDRFNNAQPVGTEAIRSGHEFGGSLRCEISPRWALELEATRMRGSGTTTNHFFEQDVVPFTSVHTEETAVPLNVILRFAGTRTASLRVFAGGGLLTGARWRTTLPGRLEESSASVTRPYAQGGLEAGWKVHQGFELTGRVLGRLAQANHVLTSDGSDLAIDHTGFAIALGGRFGLSL
jgi:hypothetical protein